LYYFWPHVHFFSNLSLLSLTGEYGGPAERVRVTPFAEGWIGYLEWARRSGRLDEIHSIDDHLDHDIDELMA
jgi:hypothetical protein